jgi:hypothetical protein
MGSVVSISRASFRSLALSAASGFSRRVGVRVGAIDPSYPAPDERAV